jgi:hypothetical protein
MSNVRRHEERPLQIEPLTSPRATGRVIAVGIGYFPLEKLLGANSSEVYAAAQVSKDYIHAKYLQLMLSAALRAVERAQLQPEVEQQVVQGIYDWISEQPQSKRLLLLEGIEETTDAFALAEADDLVKEKGAGEFSQIELEFFDRLVALGSEDKSRQRACLQLSTVLPRELWIVNQASALASLRRAELLSTQ